MKEVWGFLLAVGMAWAAGFGVSPPAVNLTVSPGERASGVLTVFSSDPTLRLSPSVVDFRLGPEGELEILPEGTLPESLAPYLEAPAEPFAAGPRHVLRYRVTLPESASGCYYAGLLLRPLGPPPEAGGLRLATRVGFLVMFFAQAKGSTVPAVRIAEARYGPGGLEAWIENPGDACLHVSATAEALDRAGNTIEQWPLLRDYLLPGGSRRIAAALALPEAAVALRLRVEAPGARPVVWEVGR